MDVCIPLKYLTEVIYSFHMPLFIFLSGVIYCKCIQAGKYNSYGKFILNKSKRLLIPYFFFGICVVAPVMCALNIVWQPHYLYIFRGIVLGLNSRHLWFLLVLFFSFAVTGLINWLMKRNIVFTICIFAFSLIASSVSNRFTNLFCISDFFGYYCYFIGGYLFASISSLEYKTIRSKIFLAISNLGFIFLMIVKYKVFNNSLLSIIISFFGIFACIGWSGIITPVLSKMRVYKTIQPNTMGIYLFHPVIVYICFYIIKDLTISPYIVSAVTVMISFGISLMLTVLLKKINCGFLIGE